MDSLAAKRFGFAYYSRGPFLVSFSQKLVSLSFSSHFLVIFLSFHHDHHFHLSWSSHFLLIQSIQTILGTKGICFFVYFISEKTIETIEIEWKLRPFKRSTLLLCWWEPTPSLSFSKIEKRCIQKEMHTKRILFILICILQFDALFLCRILDTFQFLFSPAPFSHPFQHEHSSSLLKSLYKSLCKSLY